MTALWSGPPLLLLLLLPPLLLHKQGQARGQAWGHAQLEAQHRARTCKQQG